MDPSVGVIVLESRDISRLNVRHMFLISDPSRLSLDLAIIWVWLTQVYTTVFLATFTLTVIGASSSDMMWGSITAYQGKMNCNFIILL